MVQSFHATVETLLLLIVFAVALIARWARLPYTVALNDGAAITLFGIVLAAITTGQASIAAGVLRFLVTVIGTLGSQVLRRVDSAQIQLTTTVIAAYGAYLLAERLSVSGAIALVVAGLLIGNYGAASGLRVCSVHVLATTWEFLGFVANSLIFLLRRVAHRVHLKSSVSRVWAIGSF